MDPRLARTVLVANQKGGVGKSSIVAAIGGMLAGPERRVLIVDADQQGNVTRSDLGVDGDRGQSLAMALQYTQPLTPVHDVRPGLDIVPGGPHLATVGAMVATASSSGLDIAELGGDPGGSVRARTICTRAHRLRARRRTDARCATRHRPLPTGALM
ncbi:MAG: ParA family protein [Mycobacterium sp.]